MTNPKYGSLEVFYTYPSNTAKSIELLTNIQGVKQFAVGFEELEDCQVNVTSLLDTGEIFVKVQVLLGGVVIDESDFPTYQGSNIDFAVRIFFFDHLLSVSLNDKWVYSYAFATMAYSADGTTASLKMEGATTTVTDIRRVELSDGREAVYVDYEASTDNAIQSVIQQRPVQVLPHVNRKLTFTYAAEKDDVDAVFVEKYEEQYTHPGSLSSDGLVYAEDVGVSIDLETAKEVGLITKLYRLSELNTGAEEAAYMMQKRAREQRIRKTVTQRLDPRIEVTDVLHLDLVTTSTNRHLVEDIIVEDVRISLRDGDSSMVISGRRKSAG